MCVPDTSPHNHEALSQQTINPQLEVPHLPLSTPHSLQSSRSNPDTTPRGHIYAASAAPEYNSDSAESLHEIPVTKTYAGSVYNGIQPAQLSQPRSFNINGFPPLPEITTAYTGDKQSLSYKKKYRHRHRGDRYENHENDNGAEYMYKVPTPRYKRPSEVPPLDLSSLNEESEEEDYRPNSQKKLRKKKQVSKI